MLTPSVSTVMFGRATNLSSTVALFTARYSPLSSAVVSTICLTCFEEYSLKAGHRSASRSARAACTR